jgi:hypothetical protein
MNEQEIGFKEKEIKDRLLQAYRIDLDLAVETLAEMDESILAGEVSADGALWLQEKCSAVIEPVAKTL